MESARVGETEQGLARIRRKSAGFSRQVSDLRRLLVLRGPSKTRPRCQEIGAGDREFFLGEIPQRLRERARELQRQDRDLGLVGAHTSLGPGLSEPPSSSRRPDSTGAPRDRKAYPFLALCPVRGRNIPDKLAQVAWLTEKPRDSTATASSSRSDGVHGLLHAGVDQRRLNAEKAQDAPSPKLRAARPAGTLRTPIDAWTSRSPPRCARRP
jgi:hypothetical protein